MKYRLEISSVAEAEADRTFLKISQVISPESARRWYERLLQAIESLLVMPKRCPVARENEYFTQEIRQLLYGRGRSSYRILFTILEDEDTSIVRILHIRHATQQILGESQESDEI